MYECVSINFEAESNHKGMNVYPLPQKLSQTISRILLTELPNINPSKEFSDTSCHVQANGRQDVQRSLGHLQLARLRVSFLPSL